MTQYLDNVIGQSSVKTRLQIYADSYKKDGILPFIMIVANKGGGKTKLVREFRKTLVRADGSKPPLIEVNCASIKSAEGFFNQIYHTWVDNGATLFCDEAHMLPQRLQEIFLTVLDKDRNPIRRITFGGEEYIFDFTQISFVCATTDHQKIGGALDDRLTKISLAQYNKEELFEILKHNLEDVDICNKIHPLIKDIFRGHPRHCVEIAEDLQKYAAAKSISKIEEHHWGEFCSIMGIHDHGFNEAEMAIIRVLGERGESSLEALAASTGFSRGAIRSRYEHALLSRGVMEISQRRSLTVKGRLFYNKIKDRV